MMEGLQICEEECCSTVRENMSWCATYIEKGE